MVIYKLNKYILHFAFIFHTNFHICLLLLGTCCMYLGSTLVVTILSSLFSLQISTCPTWWCIFTNTETYISTTRQPSMLPSSRTTYASSVSLSNAINGWCHSAAKPIGSDRSIFKALPLPSLDTSTPSFSCFDKAITTAIFFDNSLVQTVAMNPDIFLLMNPKHHTDRLHWRL